MRVNLVSIIFLEHNKLNLLESVYIQPKPHTHILYILYYMPFNRLNDYMVVVRTKIFQQHICMRMQPASHLLQVVNISQLSCLLSTPTTSHTHTPSHINVSTTFGHLNTTSNKHIYILLWYDVIFSSGSATRVRCVMIFFAYLNICYLTNTYTVFFLYFSFLLHILATSISLERRSRTSAMKIYQRKKKEMYV